MYIKQANSLGFGQKYVYDRIDVRVVSLALTLGSLSCEWQTTTTTISTKSAPTYIYIFNRVDTKYYPAVCLLNILTIACEIVKVNEWMKIVMREAQTTNKIEIKRRARQHFCANKNTTLTTRVYFKIKMYSTNIWSLQNYYFICSVYLIGI